MLVAIFQNLFGLLLALLLERDTRVNRFARVMFFIPVIMSALAAGYVFQAILKPDGQPQRDPRRRRRHLSTTRGWGTRRGRWSWSALIHSWKWMGLSMLIYLAGLKTISEDIARGRPARRRLPLAHVPESGSRCWRPRSPSTSRPPCSAR